MTKKVLQLKTFYLVDAIIETKIKKFNENFTTIAEVEFIKNMIEKRCKKNNLTLTFVDVYPKKFLNLTNGIFTMFNNNPGSLKTTMSNVEIVPIIYDQNFIYLCLCDMIINKLYNSIDHTCLNCSVGCCGSLNKFDNGCRRWDYDFKNETQKSLRKIL